jgi:hypothetical protein
MDLGVGYPITVANGPPNYPDDECAMWVDWNQDLDFDDPDEAIVVSGTPGPGPYFATITPPMDAALGDTRMRVRIANGGPVDPCGDTFYGEVEDYTIAVQAFSYGGFGAGGCTSFVNVYNKQCAYSPLAYVWLVHSY